MEYRDIDGKLVPLQLLQLKADNTRFAIGYWFVPGPSNPKWRCIKYKLASRWWDEHLDWDSFIRNNFWTRIDTGQTVEEFIGRHFEIFL